MFTFDAVEADELFPLANLLFLVLRPICVLLVFAFMRPACKLSAVNSEQVDSSDCIFKVRTDHDPNFCDFLLLQAVIATQVIDSCSVKSLVVAFLAVGQCHMDTVNAGIWFDVEAPTDCERFQGQLIV